MRRLSKWLIRLGLRIAPREEVEPMLINLFAFQVFKGWITIEQVPEICRARVQEVVDGMMVGLDK